MCLRWELSTNDEVISLWSHPAAVFLLNALDKGLHRCVQNILVLRLTKSLSVVFCLPAATLLNAKTGQRFLGASRECLTLSTGAIQSSACEGRGREVHRETLVSKFYISWNSCVNIRISADTRNSQLVSSKQKLCTWCGRIQGVWVRDKAPTKIQIYQ